MASILEYLPAPLTVIREFSALTSAEDPELASLWSALDDAFKDQFIDEATATGVRRWEEQLELTPKATDTLAERRLRIKARINEQLPYTYRTLDQKLTTLCGERVTLFDKFLEDVPAASWSIEAITNFVNTYGSPITYSNLFSNADLNATGTWSGIGGTFSVSGGKATITGAGSTAAPAIAQTIVPNRTQAGRRYFMRGKGKVSQPATQMGCSIRGTTSGTIYGTLISNPNVGEEYEMSSIVTETASAVGNIRLAYAARHGTMAEATGQVFEMREPLALDIGDNTQLLTLETRLGRQLTAQELNILLPSVATSYEPQDVGGYTLEVDTENYTVTVRVALTSSANFDEVNALLERVVPANMVLDVSLLYNQYSLLQSFSHSALSAYTHQQLREQDI